MGTHKPNTTPQFLKDGLREGFACSTHISAQRCSKDVTALNIALGGARRSWGIWGVVGMLRGRRKWTPWDEAPHQHHSHWRMLVLIQPWLGSVLRCPCPDHQALFDVVDIAGSVTLNLGEILNGGLAPAAAFTEYAPNWFRGEVSGIWGAGLVPPCFLGYLR